MTCGISVVFPRNSVFSTKKTDHHDAAEILLKVALNTIALTRTGYFRPAKTNMDTKKERNISTISHFL